MENHNGNSGSVRAKVLAAITSGKVTMRPRWHFVLWAILAVVGIVILSLTLLYLVSFIVFSLRLSGAWSAPLFGLRGWFVFLRSLPWVLVLLCLAFIAILEVLVRRYAFAYRQPLLYSALGIILLVVVGAAVVSRSHLHDRLFLRARTHRLPFGGEFYRRARFRRPPSVTTASVVEITDRRFVVQDREGTFFRVFTNPRTRIRAARTLRVGDTVVIVGARNAEIIQAFGIRLLQE